MPKRATLRVQTRQRQVGRLGREFSVSDWSQGMACGWLTMRRSCGLAPEPCDAGQESGHTCTVALPPQPSSSLEDSVGYLCYGPIWPVRAKPNAADTKEKVLPRDGL